MPKNLMGTLRATYRDFPEPVPAILEHSSAEDVIRTDLYDFAPIKIWHKDHFVLIGDAAHAMTPTLGQGGAQAIEDAYALTLALEQTKSPKAAFERFEKMRQAKARIVRLAWLSGKMAHTTPKWLRRVRNTGLKLIPKRINQQQAEALYQLKF